MSRRVATVGDNCIDYYIPPIDRAAVGGQALNVAVYWRLLGLTSEYIGAVGDDEDGAAILRALREQGVIADRIEVRPGRTGLTRFDIGRGGERHIVFEDLGVCGEYAPAPDDLDHLMGFDYVHCAQLADFRTPAGKLSSRGVRVSYDFSIDAKTEDLEAFDTVFYGIDGSKDHDRAVEIAEAAVRGGAERAVVTLGAQGSLVADRNGVVRAQAIPVEAVDTCGAGDSFAATFLARLLDEAPLEECLRGASAAASHAVLHLGAWPQELEQREEAPA